MMTPPPHTHTHILSKPVFREETTRAKVPSKSTPSHEIKNLQTSSLGKKKANSTKKKESTKLGNPY